MNSKTKFGLTISALAFVAILLLIALIAVSVYGVSKINNFGFAFKATKVNGFIQAEYSFAGKTTKMTTDGNENGETMLNYNGEQTSSTKQLKLQDSDTIVLSKENNYVVFAYCFSNTNEHDAFNLYVTYQDTQKTDINIKLLWFASKNEEVENFPPEQPMNTSSNEEEPDTTPYSQEFFANPISALPIEPGKTYLYLKAQVIDTESKAEFSGDFTFQMIG